MCYTFNDLEGNVKTYLVRGSLDSGMRLPMSDSHSCPKGVPFSFQFKGRTKMF